MPSISIKAVLAGVGFNLVVNWVLGSAAILIMMRGDLGALPIEQQRIAIGASSYSRFIAPLVVGGVMIASGYIAARVAGRAELAHGAWASIFFVVSGIASLVMYSDIVLGEVVIRNVIQSALAPFLGLLGGYLCRRTRRAPA